MGILGFVGRKRHNAVLAELRIARAHANIAERQRETIEAHTPMRFRVCSIPLDPMEMTARARVVESSARCEWDGRKIICYTDSEPTDAICNAIVAAIMPQVDRT